MKLMKKVSILTNFERGMQKVNEKLSDIIRLLEEKGYDPVEQLRGYIELGNIEYITRHGRARDKIKGIDKAIILDYLNTDKKLN